MKVSIKFIILIVTSIVTLNCSYHKKDEFKTKEVYKSKNLIITQITQNTFQHTSYKQTDTFGNVPCNGMIAINNGECVIFDTPINDNESRRLVKWIKEKLHCKIKAVIPTHFHDDCLGGLQAFHQSSIPSYAYYKTIELAKENSFVIPQNSFKDSLNLQIGNEIVIAKFFGEGHTKDNVVGYFPSENAMFGGCLIKELNANKGYLGDANIADWSNTVEKVRNEYPNVKTVIPGHGQYGDKKLLDYTINLFKTQ